MNSSYLQKIYQLTKPLLFKTDAERAHAFASASMRIVTPFIRSSGIKYRTPRVIFDRKVYSPIGIAAGFDKAAAAPLYLHKLGFGFLESGSLTPKAQSGNPKPRLARLPDQEV
ncbi:MAG TPA: quinone-dependent dihydroorotate dehydrogenase, partial [Turneriella sp.]|nr:quinone-dependent dihydroorotate dehydrogenase [Turneriella sp.]